LCGYKSLHLQREKILEEFKNVVLKKYLEIRTKTQVSYFRCKKNKFCVYVEKETWEVIMCWSCSEGR